ncbi:MAG: hypothetical protein AB8E15_13260 [Bdellovibrionales bacterium]
MRFVGTFFLFITLGTLVACQQATVLESVGTGGNEIPSLLNPADLIDFQKSGVPIDVSLSSNHFKIMKELSDGKLLVQQSTFNTENGYCDFSHLSPIDGKLTKLINAECQITSMFYSQSALDSSGNSFFFKGDIFFYSDNSISANKVINLSTGAIVSSPYLNGFDSFHSVHRDFEGKFIVIGQHEDDGVKDRIYRIDADGSNRVSLGGTNIFLFHLQKGYAVYRESGSFVNRQVNLDGTRPSNVTGAPWTSEDTGTYGFFLSSGNMIKRTLSSGSNSTIDSSVLTMMVQNNNQIVYYKSDGLYLYDIGDDTTTLLTDKVSANKYRVSLDGTHTLALVNNQFGAGETRFIRIKHSDKSIENLGLAPAGTNFTFLTNTDGSKFVITNRVGLSSPYQYNSYFFDLSVGSFQQLVKEDGLISSVNGVNFYGPDDRYFRTISTKTRIYDSSSINDVFEPENNFSNFIYTSTPERFYFDMNGKKGVVRYVNKDLELSDKELNYQDYSDDIQAFVQSEDGATAVLVGSREVIVFNILENKLKRIEFENFIPRFTLVSKDKLNQDTYILIPGDNESSGDDEFRFIRLSEPDNIIFGDTQLQSISWSNYIKGFRIGKNGRTIYYSVRLSGSNVFYRALDMSSGVIKQLGIPGFHTEYFPAVETDAILAGDTLSGVFSLINQDDFSYRRFYLSARSPFSSERHIFMRLVGTKIVASDENRYVFSFDIDSSANLTLGRISNREDGFYTNVKNVMIDTVADRTFIPIDGTVAGIALSVRSSDGSVSQVLHQPASGHKGIDSVQLDTVRQKVIFTADINTPGTFELFEMNYDGTSLQGITPYATNSMSNVGIKKLGFTGDIGSDKALVLLGNAYQYESTLIQSKPQIGTIDHLALDKNIKRYAAITGPNNLRRIYTYDGNANRMDSFRSTKFDNVEPIAYSEKNGIGVSLGVKDGRIQFYREK